MVVDGVSRLGMGTFVCYKWTRPLLEGQAQSVFLLRFCLAGIYPLSFSRAWNLPDGCVSFSLYQEHLEQCSKTVTSRFTSQCTIAWSDEAFCSDSVEATSICVKCLLIQKSTSEADILHRGT